MSITIEDLLNSKDLLNHDKRMKVFSTEGAKKGFLKSEDLL